MLTLTTADGYPIAATRYPAQGTTRAHLVVMLATGVPQGFYRRFAQFASSQGYAVMTIDYRGIGRSETGLAQGLSHGLSGLGPPGSGRRGRGHERARPAAVHRRPLLRRPCLRPAAQPSQGRRPVHLRHRRRLGRLDAAGRAPARQTDVGRDRPR
ncbi:hypothetical protein LP420_04705 [Massilia sp. B-10]|nr:hypothetical protein LP420_04705 [Massilia sp. B-10]